MTEKARADLTSCLEEMAALSPWLKGDDAGTALFVAAFAAARSRALAGVPAYVEAAKKSTDRDLKPWLADMAALARWADAENPEHAPFVTAFEAARANALAAAAEAVKKT
jgi:hypothetical protein